MITNAVIFDSNFIYQWQLNTITRLLNNNATSIEGIIVLNRKEFSFSLLGKAYFTQSNVSKSISRDQLAHFAREANLKIVQIDHLEDSIDVERIKNRLETDRFNFVLDFTSLSVKGDIKSICDWGFWKLKFSADEKISSLPVGFTEILKGRKIIHAQLIAVLTETSCYQTSEICVGTFRFSYFKTLKKLIYHTNYLIEQSINSFSNGAELVDQVRVSYSPKEYPNSIQTILVLLRQLVEGFRFFYDRAFFTDKWNIGYTKKPISAFLKPVDNKDIIWIDFKKKNKFIADPFAYKSNGVTRLIYEELDYSEGVGYINASEISGNNILNEETIFKTNSHFSYPYIIHHEGSVYCVPETSEAEEIALYKLDEATGKWEKIKVLVPEIRGIDNTVFFHDGLWWLFTTKAKNRPHEIVYLYYASTLDGDWKPHTHNPVKIDIRSARGAGTPFKYENEWYRPAQDYSLEIEGRIRLNKITKISPTSFEEREVCIINPFSESDFPHKIHTLCDAGDFTIIDGCRKVFILGHPGFIFFKFKRIYNFFTRYISRFKK